RRWEPERILELLVISSQGDDGAIVETAGVGAAIHRVAVERHADEIVGMVVLDVINGGLDAELTVPRLSLLNICSQSALTGGVVAEPIDERHRAEPELVARPGDIVGVVHVR